MVRQLPRLLLLCLLLAAMGLPPAAAQKPKAPEAKAKKSRKDDSKQRAESLRRLAAHLAVGRGSSIADIGAGRGRDTWVFAEIVGESGTVYSEEIKEELTGAITAEAKKRGLGQVKAVLGTATEPKLLEASVDLAFMHYVYHHMARPREMLQGIWKALKPGGRLVVVDRRFGTLQDWVPREQRAKKHFWIAETTVVREAREEGFEFVECAESCWHAKDTFVLVFKRPEDLKSPGRDPDPLPPIPEDAVDHLLPQAGEKFQRVAFIALGEGRKLIGPVLKGSSSEAVDLVLEEWATRKDERPELPSGVKMPSALTDKGDPKLGPEPLDAVYFLDTYHLLFHGPALLEHLGDRLAPSGKVFVLDRRAPRKMPHREASHRRMIHPDTVKEEMAKAGFVLLREAPAPGDRRFLLVFGKRG